MTADGDERTTSNEDGAVVDITLHAISVSKNKDKQGIHQ